MWELAMDHNDIMPLPHGQWNLLGEECVRALCVLAIELRL